VAEKYPTDSVSFDSADGVIRKCERLLNEIVETVLSESAA